MSQSTTSGWNWRAAWTPSLPEAATTVALWLAGTRSRLGLAVSKYWVCKRAPAHAAEALECLGGNGYVEELPLARYYREAPVNAIWEGSGNVMALDLLRVLTRDRDQFDLVFSMLERDLGASGLSRPPS